MPEFFYVCCLHEYYFSLGIKNNVVTLFCLLLKFGYFFHAECELNGKWHVVELKSCGKPTCMTNEDKMQYIFYLTLLLVSLVSEM